MDVRLGQLDARPFFISFQRDLGSSPGCSAGGFLGETLFA
jgi:hypothetical protein